MPQRRNAYLIGANGPENQQNITPLKYTGKDIKRLQKALSTYPCAFTSVESIIATTPLAVLPGLERLANTCERSDLLMVHFAGHAFPWGGRLHLICNQTDVDQKLFTSTAIDINAVKNILNQCSAKHKLLVLDCCHAGIAHGGGTWRGEQELGYALEDLKGTASIILSACAPHKRTRELDTLEFENEYGAGFLSWALASAFTKELASIVDDQALSFTDFWKWLPEVLRKVNKDLKNDEQIPTPLIFREEESGTDNEIWFTSNRRDATKINTSDEQRHREELAIHEREPFLQQYCYGANVDDFNEDKLMQYAQHQEDYNRLSIKNLKELCKQLDLTSSLDTPRRSAILLFHRMPNRYLHSALIRVDARAESNKTNVSEKPYMREEIVGPLDEQVEKALKWIMSKLHTISENIGANKRTDRCEIPENALREIVVNAIVHRDYEANASIRIKITPKQITITNPGQLNSAIMNCNPPFVYGHSQASNPLLLDVFIKQGWAEGLSRGFEIIMEEFERYALPLPEIKNLPSGLVQVTIQRPDISTLLQNETKLSDTIQAVELSDQELVVMPKLQPAIWNIPYSRNMFFTGREELLMHLATVLQMGQPTAMEPLQAISGLGGIGKTQVALEYAYRYRDKYQAILWTQANTKEALTSSYLELVVLLNLPEKDTQESAQAIVAMKKWLQNSTGYLLILDNADDLVLAREFLPSALGGHVLLTTRAQSTGWFAQRVNVDVLPTEQGVEFLLRRAGILAPYAMLEQVTEQNKRVAREICEELGGLPLALDQAGAYIEETQSSLVDYHSLYRTQRAEVLRERGGLAPDHPFPVATTWSLSFQQVEQQNPTAADILRLCAFLAPDTIPESILTTGIEQMGPLLQGLADHPLALNKAIAVLGNYSLIRRDASTYVLSLHRLVQAVLKDQMKEEEQRQWAERVVQTVNKAFPHIELQTWPQCEQLLPHALVCRELIEQYQLYTLEAAHLLNQTSTYLRERARYQEAEQLSQRALAIREQQLGSLHPDTTMSLNNLALLYHDQGKYREAEPLYQRALAIREQQLGAMHPDTANSLNNLASLYQEQGKYEQAELLLERVLAIREEQLGALHPSTATSLNTLALLYYQQRKYEQAEPLFERALAIDEQAYGPDHPDVATDLNNLALLYHDQGKYGEADPLYQRALAIREQQLGAMHPDTASSLNNLAELYREQGKYGEAEPLYQRALAIREQQLGTLHPDTASSLNNLALLYHDQGKYGEAEPLYQRALAIREQQLGAMHPKVATSLNNLAELYRAQGKYREADPLYQRALAIREQQLGTLHPDTASSLNNLALLYHDQGKYGEAEPLYERALAIYEQRLGTLHPDTASSLNNLAELYREQGKYGEADPLYQRALAIDEQVYGSEHPKVATDLNNLALLYHDQGKYEQAESLYEQALAIYEQSLGTEHPTTQTVQGNYTDLLEKMGQG